MKRPEGFDRAPSRPAPPEQAEAESSREEGSTSSPAKAATSTSTATSTGRPAASRAAAPRPTSDASTPASPRFLPQRDTTADEAKERAREARRDARRAAAERRIVEKTEVRRFTRRSRNRRTGWIVAGAVVVALVGSVTVSVFSPLLSLQTITVEGTSRVDKAQVLQSLHGQIGKPLAMIDFSAVKSDLAAFPLIQSYVTETTPPHTLVIRITEREPIASVKVGKIYDLVDPAGVLITTSTTQPKSVPLVDLRGSTVDGAVFRAAAEVLLALPATLKSTVTGVSASTADDVTLTLSTGEQVVWGSADSSDQKAQLLAGLIKSHKATNPTQSVEYDVSAPDNGIIRTK